MPQRYRLKLGKLKTLSPVFCGSFEVVKRIGPIAYERKLLDDWKINIIFHMSLLRNFYVLDPNHIFIEFHILAFEGELLKEYEKIV